MSNRTDIIEKIEKSRKSKVICYLTGDRQQFATNISEDIIPILYRHLELIGDQEKIDLLLYTRGGDMVVPLRIVNLIRNYCKRFSVLIPYRCHSAGTMISLGADEILMTKLAELTPVDPTSNIHAFNPKAPNPANPTQLISLPVSVEDVRSYLTFAQEVLEAKNEQLVDLYSKMTDQVNPNNSLHPLALGNVYRVQKMIKIIIRKLLEMHFKKNDGKNDETIKGIIKEMTENISVHNYPIYVDEVKNLKLNAHKADKSLEELMWSIFELYADDMKLAVPFSPIEEIGANISISGNCHGAFIESVEAEDVFNFIYEIQKIQQQPINFQNIPGHVVPPPGAPVTINMNISKMRWEKIR